MIRKAVVETLWPKAFVTLQAWLHIIFSLHPICIPESLQSAMCCKFCPKNSFTRCMKEGLKPFPLYYFPIWIRLGEPLFVLLEKLICGMHTAIGRYGLTFLVGNQWFLRTFSGQENDTKERKGLKFFSPWTLVSVQIRLLHVWILNSSKHGNHGSHPIISFHSGIGQDARKMCRHFTT